MSDCIERGHLHEYLDGELSPTAARDFLRHAEICASCRVELASYRRVDVLLASATRLEPPARVSERVLDAVLPSRRRRAARLRQLGLVYAGALAACLIALGVWLARPGTVSLLTLIGATASKRLIQLFVFTIHSGASALLSLANGWGLVTSIGVFLAPLGRALATAFGQLGVGLALAPAVLACAALLWWMRSRRGDLNRRIGNVGVLGI